MRKIKDTSALNLEVAKKLFYYDHLEGELYWRFRDNTDPDLLKLSSKRGINIANKQIAGKKIGIVVSNKVGNQYKVFTLSSGGKPSNYQVHRVIWFLLNGVWPEELDHEDGNGLNNYFYNLRDVNRSENSRNHRLPSNNNVTKISGVRFYTHTKTPLWQAYCYDGVERKQIQLGNFDDFFEAICARKSYEFSNGYSERHGR